jgi:queuine tRNA-ribosyltransferase
MVVLPLQIMNYFNIVAGGSGQNARAGILETGHGQVLTPVFMPVGTLGSVKGIDHISLREICRAQIMLGNTYHLYLRPGMDVIGEAGGLHKFMSWDYPVLTDSGGYQVFSLAANRKLTEEGATFRSHIDGSSHLFTPENVVEIQRTIGSDIMMALDECTPYPCTETYAEKSLDLTHHWLERGFRKYQETSPLYGHHQHYFPIVQGSVYSGLRRKSAAFIAGFPATGYAIGGLSVGEPAEMMYGMIEEVNSILPADKPRYLMGVGTPVNLLEGIDRGIDMFDCVMPTRNGRNGMLFTRNGIINIRNEKWRNDFGPIDTDGLCPTDLHYTKAYLRHLFIAEEMLGPQLASIHNICFYIWLMREAREKIISGDFSTWKAEMVNQLSVRL